MKLVALVLYYVIIACITLAEGIVTLFEKGQQTMLRKKKQIKRLSRRVGTKSKRNIASYQETLSLRLGALKETVKNTITTIKSRNRSSQKRKKPIVIYPFPVITKVKYFFIGSVFSLIFIFLPLLLYIFLLDLPNPRELTLRQIPQTTKIYDRNGALLYQIYATQNRTVIPLSAVPKHLKDATLAIEDKNFYKHPGFDIASIIRAFHENLTGGVFQGGSTLTQQLIKSSMLTPEPTIVRKVKEIILAFWAERLYTKNQILEMYFNQVPYGGTAWGVEAAAEVYFNKNVKDLTLAESAFLAGITAAPTTYSPYGSHPELGRNRQKEVLNRMEILGYISSAQKQEAEQYPLVFRKPQTPVRAPHFVDYVREYLINKYGLYMVERGGLQVTTSLDLTTQEMAQKVVSEEVANYTYLHLTNGATVVTNPKNGDILAMVGSKDFFDENDGKVNVTTSDRQPGSTIKVVTYSAALSHGFTAASILDDSPITYATPGSPSYTPQNYDGRFYGRIPLRFALANSLNIPAVKTLHQIGVPTMVNLGKNMGVSQWGDADQYGLSITLGAAEVTMLDMATVFGTLANGGIRRDVNPLLKVTDIRGAVLEEKTEVAGRRVLAEGIAFIISDILADNAARSVAFGSNSILRIPGHTVSVKTGTSDNKRDNWTVGYTSDFVVAVWVGNNDNSPMSQSLASGITGAAPIWHRIMTSLIEKEPDKKPAVPSDIVQKPCLGRNEYFLAGTENSGNCGSFRFLPLTRERR